MIGYSEVLQTMAAMVLFSLILMTSNKIILLNSQQEVESEAEKRAISIAQSYINKARALPFDENTRNSIPSQVPEGFSNTGSGSATNEGDFNDFDDYHDFSTQVDWYPSENDNAFQVDIEVLYVSSPNYDMASGRTGTPYTMYKKMVVTVTSDYLTDYNNVPIDVSLSYLRRYYKTE